jgi:hypothetical protein
VPYAIYAEKAKLAFEIEPPIYLDGAFAVPTVGSVNFGPGDGLFAGFGAIAGPPVNGGGNALYSLALGGHALFATDADVAAPAGNDLIVAQAQSATSSAIVATNVNGAATAPTLVASNSGNGDAVATALSIQNGGITVGGNSKPAGSVAVAGAWALLSGVGYYLDVVINNGLVQSTSMVLLTCESPGIAGAEGSVTVWAGLGVPLLCQQCFYQASLPCYPLLTQQWHTEPSVFPGRQMCHAPGAEIGLFAQVRSKTAGTSMTVRVCALGCDLNNDGICNLVDVALAQDITGTVNYLIINPE